MRHAKGIRRIAAAIGNVVSGPSTPATLATKAPPAPRVLDDSAAEARGRLMAAWETDELGGVDVVVRMLGPFELSLGETPVEYWASVKGLAVLKYLLLHAPRPVRRETLMDLLWPGYRPQSARNNLNVAIYALRRSVEAAAGDVALLHYRDGCYVLNPTLSWWVDLKRFRATLASGDEATGRGARGEAMEWYLRAVGFYRGPLFEDDVRSEWHLDEQRALQDLYLGASEAVASLHLEAGEVAEALATGQEVLRTDPCRESTHRLLMRCFALQQQRQLVARQFRKCVEVLERELGLPPAGETLRLYRELTEGA